MSGNERVVIPHKLDVAAVWSWNLNVVVFKSCNLHVVASSKKCLWISLSSLYDLCFPGDELVVREGIRRELNGLMANSKCPQFYTKKLHFSTTF